MVLSMDMAVGKYFWRQVLSMDTSVEQYLEMGVTSPIVWTWQLQDPSHREEQEKCFSLSMDYGKANIGFLPVEYA
jgi:hypothetical protein